MIAVITGDIIASRKLKDQTVWSKPLRDLFNQYGKSPGTWEIFRGDSFQIEVLPEDALRAALRIKSLIKTVSPDSDRKLKSPIDVRMAIGIGERGQGSGQISEDNGFAFIFSGETFETLKKQKITLAIRSEQKKFDEIMNLYLKLAQKVMDNWSISSGELMQAVLENPTSTQAEIGKMLGIGQNSVSGRYKRAQVEEILEMERFYRQNVSSLKP
tara:strand:- start:56 stop:697 length:642 start_codon:yes stop_codon:yes gene_type:complete